MMLHHMLDIINGKERGKVISGHPAALAEFKQLTSKAELFDFGDLHLEKGENTAGFDVPDLTPIEEGFWNDGLIPMPADLCWFEFRLIHRSGLLIKYNGPNDLKVQRIDYQDNWCHISGVWSTRLLRNDSGEEFELTAVDETCIDRIDTFDRTLRLQHFAVPVKLAMYLALMLNSKTTEIRTSDPAPKLDKARARVGKSVLPLHRIVTIVPLRFRSNVRGDGHHASPMLHWRRSHVRRYASGKAVLIPRHLVGHRELGTISHEYRFKNAVDKSGAAT